MPLSTRSLQSLARFVMVLPPVPLALADVAGTPGRHEVVLLILAVLLGLVTTLFVGIFPYGVT